MPATVVMSLGVVEGKEVADITEAMAKGRNKVAAWSNSKHILDMSEPKQ